MFKQAIVLLQDYLNHLGFKAQIHFELEGCYKIPPNSKKLDLNSINHRLALLDIDGEVVNEYWKNQWEYVSLFNGQSPLKEADNLVRAIHHLPRIFAQHGITETLIKPVVWSGDQGKLALGSSDIFTTDTRAVHIPNAIQVNVSVLNGQGVNIISKDGFGEYLQQCFLQTSKACSLLYLPEEEAFERLKLKLDYGLSAELCSPCDISGGHQGSIALYKELGKHNQQMGEEMVLIDQYSKTLVTEQNWKKTARIEHRLGASSTSYNPHANVLFSLMNIVDAIEVYIQQSCVSDFSSSLQTIELPESLYNRYQKGSDGAKDSLGAIELFIRCPWFSERINKVQQFMHIINSDSSESAHLGDLIKQQILLKYQTDKIALPTNFNLTL
jgi:hypothetical protein